jgi:hypothetical protein
MEITPKKVLPFTVVKDESHAAKQKDPLATLIGIVSESQPAAFEFGPDDLPSGGDYIKCPTCTLRIGRYAQVCRWCSNDIKFQRQVERSLRHAKWSLRVCMPLLALIAALLVIHALFYSQEGTQAPIFRIAVALFWLALPLYAYSLWCVRLKRIAAS